MTPNIWHQLQVHQEPLCSPWLQEETWRTGGVLTGSLILDVDKTSTEASEVWYISSDTTSCAPGTAMSYLILGRNNLEDRWCLDRLPDIGSWWKFHRSFIMDAPIHSKTPWRYMMERWSLDRVLIKISQKLHKDAPIHLTPSWGLSWTGISSKTLKTKFMYFIWLVDYSMY